MGVFRLDSAKAGKAVRLDNGFLRLPITATRTGIFVYRDQSGKEWRELRPASEVFHADSVESLKGVPFTDDHPKEMVTKKNAKNLTVGYTSDSVEQDGSYLKTSVTVTHEDTIDTIESAKKREVSCGYFSDLDRTPGIFNGQHYDAIQRNIRYNHVALVKKGRAGDQVKVHLDSDDAPETVMRFDSFIEIDDDIAPNPADGKPQRTDDNNPPGAKMKTILINGVAVQVEDAGFDALVTKIKKDEDDLKSAQTKATEAETAKTQLQAKFDAAEADLKAANEKLADKARFDAAVRARIDLETFAAKHLDSSVKIAELTDEQITEKLIQKSDADFKLDSVDEVSRPVYLKARLDHIMKTVKEPQGGAITKITEGLKDKARNDGKTELSAADRRQAKMDEQAEAWKKPIGYTGKK